MKGVRRYWFASCAWICVFLLTASLHSRAQQPPAQQPSQPPSTAPAAAQAQAQPAPSSDLAAQEDELIKKCNEQINVKGQFKEAEEFAKQALALSEKLGDKKRIMVAKLYLGSAFFYQGRGPEALEVMQSAAALARETGNKKGLS